MPGDREKSGQRKIARIMDLNDRSWLRHKTCELCEREFCVNNWPDQKSRTPRVMKRICCPSCQHANGKRRMAEKILVERLAKVESLTSGEVIKLVALARRVQEL